MLLEAVAKKLTTEFPSVQFFVDRGNSTLVILPIRSGFGNIEIQANGGKPIVFVGNFTHWHPSCDESELTDRQRTKIIATDIIEFLGDIFNDKVIFWGNNKGGGGFIDRDEYQQRDIRSIPTPKWLWSGILSD